MGQRAVQSIDPTVAAGHRNHCPRRDDGRANDHAVVDRIAQRGRGPAIAAQVAHGRKPRFQRLAGIVLSDDEHILDVAPGGFEAATQQVIVTRDMNVHIDQPGQDKSVCQVDDPRTAFGSGKAIAHFGDLAVADDDRRLSARLSSRLVEQTPGMDIGGGGWLRGERRTRDQSCRDRRCGPCHTHPDSLPVGRVGPAGCSIMSRKPGRSKVSGLGSSPCSLPSGRVVRG